MDAHETQALVFERPKLRYFPYRNPGQHPIAFFRIREMMERHGRSTYAA